MQDSTMDRSPGGSRESNFMNGSSGLLEYFFRSADDFQGVPPIGEPCIYAKQNEIHILFKFQKYLHLNQNSMF